MIPTYVEREFAFDLDGDRIRGRWDRVDIRPATEQVEPRRDATSRGTSPVAVAPSADVVTPTLGIMGREHVTITDYKSSDVRDPAKARQRARESLQLQIYAMGYEAMTGRLPDQVSLHFLDSGLVGRVDVDPKRIAKARRRIATAAAGIRSERFDATPDPMRLLALPVPRDLSGQRGPLTAGLSGGRPAAGPSPPTRASSRLDTHGERPHRRQHRGTTSGPVSREDERRCASSG